MFDKNYGAFVVSQQLFKLYVKLLAGTASEVQSLNPMVINTALWPMQFPSYGIILCRQSTSSSAMMKREFGTLSPSRIILSFSRL